MANEIKITTTLTYENGQLKKTIQPGTIQLPQATQGFLDQTVTINTTAEEDISVTALGTPGAAIIQSMEATTTGNFVSYGPKTSTGGMLKMCKLSPKDIHVIRWNSTTTIRAQADTAAVNVQFTILEA